MGRSIRYLLYLRVSDLTYKLIACVHHQYGNTVIGIGYKIPQIIFFLFFRWIVETLEQRWLEISLNLVFYFPLRMLV